MWPGPAHEPIVNCHLSWGWLGWGHLHHCGKCWLHWLGYSCCLSQRSVQENSQDGLRVPRESSSERAWSGDSAVKSTYMVIHNTVIPVPDDLMPSSRLCGHRQTHSSKAQPWLSWNSLCSTRLALTSRRFASPASRVLVLKKVCTTITQVHFFKVTRFLQPLCQECVSVGQFVP